MAEPTQPKNRPDLRGRASEPSDERVSFDPGAFWCANATGHLDPNGNYPLADRHLPSDECRTLTTAFDGARADLAGRPLALELYAAAPFRWPRSREADTGTRIVIECYPEPCAEDVGSVRVSLPLGEAIRLGRRMSQLVDRVTDPPLLS